jgi:hypothetical protein
VQLLVESLERALKLGRVPDAERIVQHAIAQVEELLVSGGTIESRPLADLAAQAVATTLATRDPTWAHWVLNVYGRTLRVPPVALVERLGEVVAQLRDPKLQDPKLQNHLGLMREAVSELLHRIELGALRGSGASTGSSAPAGEGVDRVGHRPSPTEEDILAIGRMEELRRSLEGEDGAPSMAGPGARHLPIA